MRKELLAATALSSATLAAWAPTVAAQTPVNWTGMHIGASAGFAVAPGGGTFTYPTGSGNAIFFDNGTPYINSPAPPYAPWPTTLAWTRGGPPARWRLVAISRPATSFTGSKATPLR